MLRRHLEQLWGPWWPLPGGLALAYVLLVTALGDFRPEHSLVLLIVWALAYTTMGARRFLKAALPYLVTVIAYDAVRYPRAALVSADRVLGCKLRAAELAWLRVGPDTTLSEWLAGHHVLALDLLCAVPYLVFAYAALGYALFLYFVDRARMQRFVWAYAIGNFISFVCWLAIPAAPPWYIREHGCGIDLGVIPSAAGLLRVDEALGIGYFRGFYARASSAFGALPSMHCAFPLMGLLVSWRAASWRTRPIHLIYTLLMAFAAVYLGHHWVIDVVAGWLVAVVSVWVASWLCTRWARLPTAEVVPATALPAEGS